MVYQCIFLLQLAYNPSKLPHLIPSHLDLPVTTNPATQVFGNTQRRRLGLSFCHQLLASCAWESYREPQTDPLFFEGQPHPKNKAFWKSKQGLWVIWGSRYISIYKHHKEKRSNNENPPGLMPFMNPTTATNRVLRHLTWNLMFGGWWGQ